MGTLWSVPAPEGMKLSFHLSREGEQNKDMSKLMEDEVERMKEGSCQGQGLDFYLGELDMVPGDSSDRIRLHDPTRKPSFALALCPQNCTPASALSQRLVTLSGVCLNRPLYLCGEGGSSGSNIPVRNISSSYTLALEPDLLKFRCL